MMAGLAARYTHPSVDGLVTLGVLQQSTFDLGFNFAEVQSLS